MTQCECESGCNSNSQEILTQIRMKLAEGVAGDHAPWGTTVKRPRVATVAVAVPVAVATVAVLPPAQTNNLRHEL